MFTNLIFNTFSFNYIIFEFLRNLTFFYFDNLIIKLFTFKNYKKLIL